MLLWVLGVCGIPFWHYVVFFVYSRFLPSSPRFGLLPSIAAAAQPDHRTAIVESTPLFGLLYLYNNLHVVHHDHPAMPWYAIPAYYRANRADLLRRNHGLVYRGYRDVIARYLLREHHAPVIGPEGASQIRPDMAESSILVTLPQASTGGGDARFSPDDPDRPALALEPWMRPEPAQQEWTL